MLVGYFSKKQAVLAGTKIYRTPTGEEVEITEVSSKGIPPNFPDVQSLGEVTSFVCVKEVVKYPFSKSLPDYDRKELKRRLEDNPFYDTFEKKRK